MRSDPSIAIARPGREGVLAVWLATLVAVGCTGTPDLAPRPARLTPRGGPAGLSTTVTITGAGFFPRTVQAASGGPVSLTTTHRAWLDDLELADVTWVDFGTLRATIPGGLALGPHTLTVENGLGRRGTLAGAWTVIQPAVLALSATVAPAQVSVGQPLTVSVTASNTGGAAIRGLTVTLTPSGAGALAGRLEGAPFDLAPGGRQVVDLRLTAAAAGAVVLGVAGQGQEDMSDRTVAGSASDLALLVQARAALVAHLFIPFAIAPDSTFQVRMLVENTGQATAEAVKPGTLAAVPGSTGALQPVTGPTPASADVPGGGQATFTWSYQLGSAGTVRLRGGAAGLDTNDRGPVSAPVVDSNQGGQLPEVTGVALDPFGDGTPVAALAVRGGLLYVGPSRDGSTFWRLDPASGTSVALPIEIAVDDGASKADNAAWRASPPATTFGASGCIPNSLACGPCNESGGGMLAGGVFAGVEWLLYAGASTNRTRYLYLATQEGSALAFAAVDLDALLPTTTVTPTAVSFAPARAGGGDRIYVALADVATRNGPHLVALSTAPAGPVLDAASPGDALNLAIASMPGVGGSAGSLSNPDSQPRVEAMAWFRERLYLASGGALVRASVAVPGGYATAPADWADATPASPAWLGRRGLPASGGSGLTPADRATPALAAFGTCGAGPCLFLARNVEGVSPPVVPQLWQCDPGLVGDADACDPFDWSLAAPNRAGDLDLAQLGDPTNGAASLLLATPRYLYLGFDNAATGVQLYRTEVVPSSRHDFHGRDGCLAGTAGCQGLGGNGFGDPGVTRFFGAQALGSAGASTLYVAAGDASSPLRLFALPE